ncbi:MAG TPA: HisA/HisF-related TIM barrel protein, partial [Promineifilum sp.]|nr:HisA/HisF-related TIM barrel protein [Promineifilum sp.]
MEFNIFPAIDLRHGRVVRLQLGAPERQTVFSTDPVA